MCFIPFPVNTNLVLCLPHLQLQQGWNHSISKLLISKWFGSISRDRLSFFPMLLLINGYLNSGWVWNVSAAKRLLVSLSEQWFLLSLHRAVKSVLRFHCVPCSQCCGISLALSVVPQPHTLWPTPAQTAPQLLLMKSKLIITRLSIKLLLLLPFHTVHHCDHCAYTQFSAVHLVLYWTTIPRIKLYLSAMQRKLCVQQSVCYINILFTFRCNKSDTQRN